MGKGPDGRIVRPIGETITMSSGEVSSGHSMKKARALTVKSPDNVQLEQRGATRPASVITPKKGRSSGRSPSLSSGK